MAVMLDRMGSTEEAPPTIVDTSLAESRARGADSGGPRYRIAAQIGVGGMGEVMAAVDDQIGREVAVKRMKVKDPSDRAIARFLREARVQGRLDHPAIVPVYELGRDEHGLPFFAMKKLAGTTLARILGGDPADPRFSRQRLLRAFAEVCLAIEFAHVRGVVHRDLKPANIILGDFGEVYVLDWGIAKVLGEDDDFADVRSDGDGTAVGTFLGTPGYAAPEQARGTPDIDGRADVYSLGCVLREILAREPGGMISPELDALCVEATAAERTSRIATTRELGERVQRYIDGDRDQAARHELSRRQLEKAKAALKAADRAEAMRAAGRALALDPESGDAAGLVTALVLEPPAEPPGELESELRTAEAGRVSGHARTAILAYFAIACFVPFVIWTGVREWGVVLAGAGMAGVLAVAAYRIMRRPQRSVGEMVLYALGNVLLMGLLERMGGPFVYVPALTCIVVMSVMAYPVFTTRSWALIAIVAAGFIAPIVMEQLGYLGKTWEIREGAVLSYGSSLAITGTPTAVLLICANVMTIVIAGVHSARIHRTARDAQRQLAAQAWHLRHLLP